MRTELQIEAANGRGGLGPGSALYLVATPIGNLEDITLRALRVLKEVDLIACEDTRQTQKLLSHYGIQTRTVSYHEHNEMTKAAELVVDLESGAKIALVTDAGMPGISDPGFRLIALAIRHHVPVVPIPGASAFLAALVASGLPTDSFRFSGFLPAKSGQRRKLIESVKDSPRTQVFYEAPHRLLETLADVCGEVLEQLKARGEVRGEVTLLIAKAESREPRAESSSVSVAQRVREIMASERVDEKAALKKVAKERGIGKSEAYREWQRSK
ncbi:MAG: 16S rRNA (cytidine(1402)-2'-O)-methyltransferase [Candidatus Koribacter versatilis]|nr:16S rRNA (cytidine(1402)-2'-O)-methyltransferase [Candidatus Koribacter versatilis]